MILKRILSLLIVLSISMMFSAGAVSFAQDAAAEAEASLKYDAKAYDRALSLMNSLLDEAVFGDAPGQLLTRAEFVRGVAKIFGVPEVESASIYSDVKEDHKYIGAINAAYFSGWISKADTFNPDAQITYPQALKIILAAADYGLLADAKGGFPTGYMTVANSIGLLKNITMADADQVSAADAAILFYNLMFAPVFEIVSWGDRMEYEKGKETYSEKIFDAYAVEGIVTATEHNSILLDAPFKKDNGRIAIDGVEYKYEDSDIYLLGKSVVAYCAKDEDSLIKQVYCLLPDRKNEEMTISAGNFEKIDGGYIQYYDDNRLQKANLDSAYKVIYNGRRVAAFEDYMIDDIGATIRLLSNNGDDEYEYIFIDSYAYGIITSVDYVNGYIAFKTPSQLIDLTDDEEHASYVRNDKGSRIEIYELAKDTAVAVKASADGRIYELTVISNTVAGLVTAVYSEANELDVDGNTYKVSNEFKKNYIDKGVIASGDRINAVIGIHGEIACLISSAAETRYGLLHDVKRDTSSLERKTYVKILTGSGEFETFELAKKITADGAEAMLNYSEAYTYISGKLAEAQADSAGPALVIRYGTNENGLITMVDFASNDTSNFGKVLDAQDSLTRYMKNAALSYRNAGFPSKVMLETSTIVFVPKDINDRDDEDNYTIGTYLMLSSNIGNYTVDVYDVDETGNAAYVVVYMADAETGKMAAYTESYMIEKVANAIVDDETGVKLQCWTNNRFETVFMPDSVNVNKTSGSRTLVPGDIVRFTMQDGKVKRVYVDYDYSTGVHVSDKKGGGEFNMPNAQHYISFVSGKVYNVGSNTILISNAADAEGNISFTYEDIRPYSINSNIACFDSATGEIRTIKIENIHTYKGYGQNADTVILRSDFGIPKSAFIIR